MVIQWVELKAASLSVEASDGSLEGTVSEPV
jgi:hypothetical protein